MDFFRPLRHAARIPVKRILVIEDQAPMRRNIALMLKMEGYETETAENGREGLEKVAAFKPDLILCDVMMPEMDGHAATREIRAHEESLALLDYQLEQRQERLNRESAAVKQARDAIRALSKSVRKRLEGVSQLDADEVRKQLREEVQLECQDGVSLPGPRAPGQAQTGLEAFQGGVEGALLQRPPSRQQVQAGALQALAIVFYGG